MSQDRVGIDLETSVGYLLKEASSALRVAMEAVLRPLGMSVTHYSCLELLAQRPGLSNSELTRGAGLTEDEQSDARQILRSMACSLREDIQAEQPVPGAEKQACPPRGDPWPARR